MGGGGFLGLGPAPSPPPAPDYRGAAQETAAGNLAAAQTATAANRVSQYTPYGNLVYTQTGVDSQGNPTWRTDTTLAPAQQQMLDIQNRTGIGLGSTINAALGRTQDVMGKEFNPNLPQVGINAGEQYQDAYMRRLAPQIEQGREALDVKLANQGIPVGSEAYRRAQLAQSQRENDLLLGATTQGFGTGLSANQQAYNQAMTNYNLPLNTLSALRTGAQVQNPTFINTPQQANTAGADFLGAAQMGYNAEMGGFNAQNAAQANFNQGLMGLGGAGIMKYSDIRTKENIEPIGVDRNGLTIYKYEYKPEFKDHELAGSGIHYGYMAQEVEQVYPYAVKTLNDGYKVVDYGLL
jgi:hypothetical protein